MKPNLWLLVNPSIACPIQYGENGADLQTEPAEEIHTAPLDPAATRHQLSTELRLFSCHDASLQEELLHSVSSSTEYMVQYTSILTLWTIKGKHLQFFRSFTACEESSIKPFVAACNLIDLTQMTLWT